LLSENITEPLSNMSTTAEPELIPETIPTRNIEIVSIFYKAMQDPSPVFYILVDE
jgi:hypothetical protein